MSQINTRKRNGKWEYRFEIAGIGGKRKQKSKGGFRTKSEALKAGTEALNFYNNTGQAPAPEANMSYADFLDMWFDEYVLPNLKSSTSRQYKTTINKHIKPALGKYRLNAIDHSALQSLLNEKSKTLCRNTVHIILAVIKKSCRYAYIEKQFINSNPSLAIQVPKNTLNSNRDIRAYSPDEITAFLNELENTPSYYAAVIAYHTGMRIGEICALTWEDIDMDNRIIHVKKTLTVAQSGAEGITLGTPKSKSSLRDVNFGNILKRELKILHTQNLENELFYGEYYYQNYMDPNGRLYKASKFEQINDKKIDFVLKHENGKLFSSHDAHYQIRKFTNGELKFHNLRHTHATELIQANVPVKTVQDRLGHADVSVTLNKYVDNTDSMKESAVTAIEDAWNKRAN